MNLVVPPEALTLLGIFCQRDRRWPIWSGISDEFLSAGDDVAADWAKWVQDKQRHPYRYKGRWEWMGRFIWAYGKRHPEAMFPNELTPDICHKNPLLRTVSFRNQFNDGHRTKADAYLFLLELWRAGDPEARQKCWALDPQKYRADPEYY